MGHTASVQRGSRHGTLYGEPAGGSAHGQYTPAQMQALYLSRGRPDMAFMSNQALLPEAPELQQTSTVRSHVNLKKGSLRLTPAPGGRLGLEFEFDATRPCRASLLVVAAETVDAATGGSTFALVHPHALPAVERRFPEGLGQRFRLCEAPEDAALDVGIFQERELQYQSGSSVYPLVIVLAVDDKSDKLQSQSTFATLERQPTGAWSVKVLKQKILVDGLAYELQEIYGMDGSVAPAKPEGEAGAAAGQSGELEIPDGAECVICMSEPRSTTVLPCRHMCLCGDCAEALRRSSSTCPICRTNVEGLLRIRVDAKDGD